MPTINPPEEGKFKPVVITVSMLERMRNGECLISQFQAHRLMSLASERRGLNEEFFDGEERSAQLDRIQAEMEKIWNDVFGK